MASNKPTLQALFEPNGKVDKLVGEFKAISRKNSESVLAQARLIASVEAELGEVYKEAFYAGVGLDGSSSAVRKFKLIGKEADRFEPYVDQLPPNWTSIYELAKLSREDFKKVIDSGSLSPALTSKEMREILHGPAVKREKQLRVTFNCDHARDQKGLAEALKHLAAAHNVDLTDDPRTKEVIKQMLQSQASPPERSVAA